MIYSVLLASRSQLREGQWWTREDLELAELRTPTHLMAGEVTVRSPHGRCSAQTARPDALFI